jgi:hypothetical protein
MNTSGMIAYQTTAGMTPYATTNGLTAYQTTNGMTVYATTSGLVIYQTTAGMASYASTAGLLRYQTTAGMSGYVSTSGLIPYVGTVGIPAQSGKAGYHLGTDGSNTVWQLDSTFYTLAADRTTNGGINASALIPEFTWSLPTSSSYAFECYLLTTQLATNLPRFGFYAPRGSGVNLAVRYNYNSTSLTTDVVNGAILGVTSTGSTGYTTAAVVASAQTSGLWRIVGAVVTDASTSGLMGLVWGTSTTTSSTTLKTGSYCRLTKLK